MFYRIILLFSTYFANFWLCRRLTGKSLWSFLLPSQASKTLFLAPNHSKNTLTSILDRSEKNNFSMKKKFFPKIFFKFFLKKNSKISILRSKIGKNGNVRPFEARRARRTCFGYLKMFLSCSGTSTYPTNILV